MRLIFEASFCIYLVQSILTGLKNSEREREKCVYGLQDWMAGWLRNACTGLVCACFQFEKYVVCSSCVNIDICVNLGNCFISVS